MSEEKPLKFKPWPKLPKGPSDSAPTLDLDKIRELYLSNPNFDWTPFCKFYGFNPKYDWQHWKRRGYDFKDWKRDWLKRQTETQDDELAPQLLAVRKHIGQQRVRFVNDWTKRTEYMKTLLDAMLRRHGEALQHDMQNTLAIQAGRVQKQFKLEPDELGSVTQTALRLQELEQRALMLVGIEMAKPEGTPATDDESLPEIDVSTMGKSGLSGSETVQLLATYFDQFEAKALPAPEVKSATPQV